MASFTPVRLAYKVYEPSEKSNLPDVLMIHGVTGCKETWDNIAKDIADRTHRTVYTLDMRNHGASEWNDVFDYEIMAKDVLHFMEDHDIESAAIIGHSMGGKTTMTLSLLAAGKVEKLIIEDATPKPMNPAPQFGTQMTNLLMHTIQQIPTDADNATAEKVLTDAFRPFLPTEKINNLELSLFIVKRDYGFTWKANLPVLKKFMTEKHFVKVPPGVSCDKPILFIYGTVSPFKVIDGKDYILKYFPNATFQAVDGAGHLVHDEYPGEFSKHVINFLNKS